MNLLRLVLPALACATVSSGCGTYLEAEQNVAPGGKLERDTLKPGELDANHAKFLGQIRRRPAAHPENVITSSEEGRGINDLRDSLAALAAQG